MAGSGEGDLRARVLAALPGTMKQIVERVGGRDGRAVWAVVADMRKEGLIKRSPAADGGDRVFSLPIAKEPTEAAQDEDKNKRLQHVILVSVRDWPHQQPGRPMVFDVRKSAPKAHRAVVRLRDQFADPVLRWWCEPLTQARIRDLQERVDSKTLRDLMERRVG